MEISEMSAMEFNEISESISKEYPPAIIPIYSAEEPNQPIQLYKGDLKITQEKVVYEGEGTVIFECFPSPNIKFEFINYNNSLYNNLLEEIPKHAFLSISEIGISAEILFSSIQKKNNYLNRKSSCQIVGIFSEPILLGSGKNLSFINFHLTNFHKITGIDISTPRNIWPGRFILEAEGWSILIDELESFKDIIKSLESEGGYAITHVGKLQRTDNTSFTAEEAEDILEALHWFLSFSRGFWTAPILLVGYSSGGEKVWEKWSANQAAPWQNSVYSWFPDYQNAQSLSKLFPGFFQRWQNKITWNEPIRLAIHWYLESNSKAGGVQGSIVLMQAAFELLSWTLIVEEKKIISQDGFEKLPAADKLRLILSQCNIQLKLPDSLSNLLQAAQHKELRWVDGAQALTEIRNAIVHANPKKRQRVLNRDVLEQTEAYELGLWYLELILLNLFEYKGEYLNRIAKKKLYDDHIESVPWS